VRDLLEFLAVGCVGDLAADAAAPRGIGHQDTVATRQRQIGGERRALVAALFLDDLHQQDLADFDDFLNLVAARTWFARGTDVFAVVFLGDRFNRIVLVGGILPVIIAMIIVGKDIIWGFRPGSP